MAAYSLTMLLQDIYPVPSNAERQITGLCLDSRIAKSGDLFFAKKGVNSDGKHFMLDAIKKGVQAIIAQAEDFEQKLIYYGAVPVFFITDFSNKLVKIAAQFFDNPAQSLQIVGITGTNGKTSCSHFIAAALQKSKSSCGVIGTLGSGIYPNLIPTGLTTPDAINLQTTFADFKNNHIPRVAMEVSSHSIEQGRILGIPFLIGVFTNLTRDHLDYHGDMAAYSQAKKRLFDPALVQYAVVNQDDACGQEIIQTWPAAERLFPYAIEATRYYPNGIYASQIEFSMQGLSAHIKSPWGEERLVSSLVGKFNLYNLLAVLASLCLLGIPFRQAINALRELAPVPGRMQTLGGGLKPLVVVDYAHTPDALEKILVALRPQVTGKLYCLFGCGGDRDRGKRPLMAKIAECYADFIMVTNDNPRHEKPEAIVADIMTGFTDSAKVSVEYDRSKAIQNVIQYAIRGDCIVIAGKGAETYQQIGDERIPFSDIEQVKKILL